MIEVIQQSEQSEHVRRRAETADGAHACGGGDRVMAKGFARGDVREMHLDDGQTARPNRVVKRDGRVRITGGIEHDADKPIIGGASNAGDQFAFVV